MKQFILIILAAISLVGCGLKEDYIEQGVYPVSGSNIDIATEFVMDIVKADFAKLRKSYAYEYKMREWMQRYDTVTSIYQTNTLYGELVEVKPAYQNDYPMCYLVQVPVRFENDNCNFVVLFNDNQQIMFYYIDEYKETHEEVKHKDNIKESDMTFQSDSLSIPGSLTLPTVGEKFPVVIIIPGSGEMDRDGTVVANTPYRDLAWRLAEKGIASFRYDKRSFIQKGYIESDMIRTIDDEITLDALAAIDFVSELSMIDQKNIYVLGHCLGGYTIPRIAEHCKKSAGYIIMSGQADNLQEIKYESYRAIDVAEKIKVPVLVLHGERDIEVPLEHYKIWYDAFCKKDNWEFKTYENLNHYMINSQAIPGPMEYYYRGNVDIRVTNDIYHFIMERGVAAISPMKAMDLVKKQYAANFKKVFYKNSKEYYYKLPIADYFLTYEGLEQDGTYYIYRLYEFVLDNSEEGIGHTVTYGWYAVDTQTGVIVDRNCTY